MAYFTSGGGKRKKKKPKGQGGTTATRAVMKVYHAAKKKSASDAAKQRAKKNSPYHVGYSGVTVEPRSKPKAGANTLTNTLRANGGFSGTKADSDRRAANTGGKHAAPMSKNYIIPKTKAQAKANAAPKAGKGSAADRRTVAQRAADQEAARRQKAVARAGGPRAAGTGSASGGRTVAQRAAALRAKQSKKAPTKKAPAKAKTPAKKKADPIVTGVDQQIKSMSQQNNRLTDFYLTQNENARQALVASGKDLATNASAYTPVTDPAAAGTPGRDALLEAANRGKLTATSDLITSNTGSVSDLFGTIAMAQRSGKTEYARRLAANRQSMIDEANTAADDRAYKQAQTQQALAATNLAAKEFGLNLGYKYDSLNSSNKNSAAQRALSAQRLKLDATNARAKAIAAQQSSGAKAAADQMKAVRKWVDEHLYKTVTVKDPSGKSVTKKVKRGDKTGAGMNYMNVLRDMLAQGFNPMVSGRYALAAAGDVYFGNGQKEDVPKFALTVYGNLIASGLSPKQARALTATKYGAKNASSAQTAYKKRNG